jgi:predicted phage gp36 major capsid-like protein
MPGQDHALAESRGRLRSLEAQLRALDARLKKDPLREIDREREKLERKFNALYEAIALLEETIPALPRCSACGKACHATREAALAHIAALTTVAPRRRTPRMTFLKPRNRVQGLSVYRCWRSEERAYHVGHLVLHQ